MTINFGKKGKMEEKKEKRKKKKMNIIWLNKMMMDLAQPNEGMAEFIAEDLAIIYQYKLVILYLNTIFK